MKNVFTVVILSVLISLLVLSAAHAKGNGNGNPTSATNQPNFVPGEILVQFRADATDEDEVRVLGKINGEALEHIKTQPMISEGRGHLVLVHSQPELPQSAAIKILTDDPAVEFAEPNWIYTRQVTADDTYYTNGSLWGMYGDSTTPSNANGSQAGEAWATGCTGSHTVYIGVIDEGIQFTHPDLQANVWTNSFDPVDGIDNDGNGEIDDIHGWDFNGSNNTIYDGGTRGRLDKHGTHVTGTIGASGGNSIGVAGVNWNVTYIAAKFLGQNGGTLANAVKAVDYITDLKNRHNLNIVATNNSWGGGGFSQALLDAINRGGNAGILFIVAAGNGGSDGVGDNNDVTPNYPSNYECTLNGNYDCVIAVAAITNNGSKASFSNYGATTVDLGAPGAGIWSTIAYNKYSSYSGTSMATPHVTGAAALYAAKNPTATAAQIKAAILDNTIATTSLSGKTVTGGRLNVSGFCQ